MYVFYNIDEDLGTRYQRSQLIEGTNELPNLDMDKIYMEAVSMLDKKEMNVQRWWTCKEVEKRDSDCHISFHATSI